MEINSLINRLNINELNTMQQTVLQATDKNDEIILLSATGSGKTLGFLLPLLKTLNPATKHPQAIVIVPSRELAQQIDDVLRKMQTGYKVTLCYGGHKREIEETNLIEAPAIIIGTAGRLADHIRRGNFNTAEISTLILDEFDKSLELGFVDEMSFIIQSLPNIKTRILTSATNTLDIPEFVGMKNPVTLNFNDEKLTQSLGLEIKTVLSNAKDKIDCLFELLCFLGNRTSIIFCNHREAVERTSNLLTEKGIVNVFYHGGMEQQERDAALCKFRNGTSEILVTTDLAARGLDIPNIRNIIHYHLPNDEATFTHRNGRTARMDASGTTYVIYSEEEKLPEYISSVATAQEFTQTFDLPEKPKWSTLFIAAGKKDKINKIDIVGFLSHKGDLKKEDIGLIEVKDFFAFAAVKKIKINATLRLIENEKIKNKKVKIAIAK